MRRPQLLLAAALTALCCLPSHVPAPRHRPAAKAEAAAPSAEWLAQARARIAAEEYRVSVHDGALLAPNRRQGLRTRFADSGVPTIIPPVGPPFIAGIAPASKSHYLLASIAVAF